MWEKLIWFILAAEAILLGCLIFEWSRKKKRSSQTVYFLCFAYGINVALNMLPCFHEILGEGYKGNAVMAIAECFSAPFKAFVGEGKFGEFSAFSEVAPLFSAAYVAGIVLAFITSVNAAILAFSNALRNDIRLSRALRQGSCDIILGTGNNAMGYAKDGAAILIPEPRIDKDGEMRLVEQGYIVMRRPLNKALLKSRLLNRHTEYNIICPGKTEANLDYIELFVSYCEEEEKQKKKAKKIRLFVEIDAKAAPIIHREIIDKSKYSARITSFCCNELLARRFQEEHPITEYMPHRFITNEGHIDPKAEGKLHVVYLGFGDRNREMYRHSVLNNQLVTLKDGAYRVLPVRYHLFDTGIQRQDWILDGLKDELESLKNQAKDYYELPDLPYNTEIVEGSPCGKEALLKAADILKGEGHFCNVIVDVGDTYQNIEIGTRLKQMVGPQSNYHIFISSETAYTEDDDLITYLGDIDDIFNHENIVNEKINGIALELHRIYKKRELSKGGAKLSDEEIKERAKQAWLEFDHFTRQSNLYSAMNLRLKLHLLGLDFEKGASSSEEMKKILASRYARPDLEKIPYEKYIEKNNTYCALLAQEKNRWNAYHLINEILPMPKSQIGITGELCKDEETGEEYVSYRGVVKNSPLTLHGCITTVEGLKALIKEMAETAYSQQGYESKFNYFEYDDQIMTAVNALMEKRKYKLIEKIDQADAFERKMEKRRKDAEDKKAAAEKKVKEFLEKQKLDAIKNAPAEPAQEPANV